MEFTVCITIWILLIYWVALTEGWKKLFLSCFLCLDLLPCSCNGSKYMEQSLARLPQCLAGFCWAFLMHMSSSLCDLSFFRSVYLQHFLPPGISANLSQKSGPMIQMSLPFQWKHQHFRTSYILKAHLRAPAFGVATLCRRGTRLHFR